MRIDRVIAAVNDPTRREMLRRLAASPRRAGELARGFAISRPAICKHARMLKTAGLIRSRRTGREQIYELAPAGGAAIRSIIAEIEEVRRFWETALESFKRHVEGKQ
jgi:DNA-binding transcriptional ArsR family regulator